MERWDAAVQRHKRPFDEVSQSATLSPSPALGFGGSFDLVPPRLPPTANDNFDHPPRRRLSHPHNTYSRRASEDMADRSQRTRLSRRASQTVIDLTSDTEDISPSHNTASQSQSRSFGPPRLDRSDATMDNMIDLTEDSPDQEVVITHSRQRQLPLPFSRPSPGAAAPRAESPAALFLPPNQPQRVIDRVFAEHGFGNLRASVGPGRIGNAGLVAGLDMHRMLNMMERLQENNAQAMPQAMPNGLNYQNAAFAPQQPEYIPPPPAQEGFTRSLTGDPDQMIICPCCEEELVQNNEVEEPIVKKSGKPPTKKEREEHPFWVVKECGHVFCNKCFQDRAKHGFSDQPKPGGSKRAKAVVCAVEDCTSDVKSKDKWVGVFM